MKITQLGAKFMFKNEPDIKFRMKKKIGYIIATSWLGWLKANFLIL